ncbi:MAG: hypothetical protein IJD46_02715 [Bacilli bacterium]|nr:hypothetical protein [Bacilli bacterium]
MEKKTLKDKTAFFFRKLAISLKRNYYIIPLVLVAVCCIQFMCSLHVLSPSFSRVSKEFGAYSCLFIFIVSLLTILGCVAYLNYALVAYGSKRPIYMLIIYYVMWIAIIALLFMLINSNNLNLADEQIKLNEAIQSNNQSQIDVYKKFIDLGNQSNKILITQLILQFVTVVLVSTAPLVQGKLKQIKFKKVDSYE